MAQKISQMTEQTTASMTEAGTSDFLGGYTTTGGNANRKFSLAGLANYFLNKFKLSLGGSNQTVKAAIDSLNSNVDRNEELAVTKNEDYIGEFSNKSYRLVGHIALINGYFKVTQSNIPAQTVLFTLPSGVEFKCRQYVPITNNWFQHRMNFEVRENTGNIKPSSTLSDISTSDYYYFCFIANIK